MCRHPARRVEGVHAGHAGLDLLADEAGGGVEEAGMVHDDGVRSAAEVVSEEVGGGGTGEAVRGGVEGDAGGSSVAARVEEPDGSWREGAGGLGKQGG